MGGMMSYSHLTHLDRLKLATLLRAGIKQKDIALELAKSPSTISRELGRNPVDNKIGYDVRNAQTNTLERRIKANQRFRKIRNNKWLEQYIKKKLKLFWSPDEIAGRLNRAMGREIISHEAIYQYIYFDNPNLKRYLRCQKGKFRRKRGTLLRAKQREDAKKRRIELRPEIINKRGRVGDWEGDTVVGHGHSGALLTHVERKSGYLVADKLARATADTVNKTTVISLSKIPKDKRLTCTYDNGLEFSEHENTEKRLEMTIYFAAPYHSWERGTNENTNGLLRQFFPKKMSFWHITQKEVEKVVKLINNRPRKRLNYLTPYEVLMRNCTWE